MRNTKGAALIIAIIFSIVMLILVSTMLTLARGHYHSTVRQIKHTRAFYLAQAGVEWALHRCRTNPGVFAIADINRPGGELVPDRIQDPPGKSYYPPIFVTISNAGTGYRVDAAVDDNDIRMIR